MSAQQVHAAIDIGTHSTRLLAGTVGPTGTQPLIRVTTVTKLGTGVDVSRHLSEDAIERTLAVLSDYRLKCENVGVSASKAVATSALRDVENARSFLDSAEAVLGFRPSVITGEQEARLTYLGTERALLGNSAAVSERLKNELMVFDIGGGSTEFVTAKTQFTTDLGCLRLTERFLRFDPPAQNGLFALRDYCREQLSAVLRQLEVSISRGKGLFGVGVAGTVTSMVAMLNELDPYDPSKVHHTPLRTVDVEMLYTRLAALSLEQRKKVRGLQPSRADVIVAGAGILATIMEVFGLQEILVSESDILDGILISTYEAAHA